MIHSRLPICLPLWENWLQLSTIHLFIYSILVYRFIDFWLLTHTLLRNNFTNWNTVSIYSSFFSSHTSSTHFQSYLRQHLSSPILFIYITSHICNNTGIIWSQSACHPGIPRSLNWVLFVYIKVHTLCSNILWDLKSAHIHH